MSVLLDAGPVLNFLAVHQENILIQLAEEHDLVLAAPQRVDAEVLGKCKDSRFKGTPADRTWRTLVRTCRVQLLDDDLTTQEFADAVARVSGMPAHERVKQRKSLGEILVIAHGSVLAQQGQDVFLLIDEFDGRRRAKAEQQWLGRNEAPGSLVLWSTGKVLQEAARHDDWIRDDLSWAEVYDKMTGFDDGLPRRRERKPG